jgi:hypothetical protein
MTTFFLFCTMYYCFREDIDDTRRQMWYIYRVHVVSQVMCNPASVRYGILLKADALRVRY